MGYKKITDLTDWLKARTQRQGAVHMNAQIIAVLLHKSKSNYLCTELTGTSHITLNDTGKWKCTF